MLAAVAVIAVTATCVRLGFWQLARLEEKRAANAALSAALAAPPLQIGAAIPPLDQVASRRVSMTGRFDESVHVLLSARARGGAPGVHVVTPFVPAGSATAVLVDRGWLESADATRARPQDHPEPGDRTVTGVARPIPRHTGLAWRRLATDPGTVTLHSARALDFDSLAARLPHAIVPYVVVELPGAGVPATPARVAPRPLDESIHWSYATQWFLFGAILFFGSLFLALSRRRPSAATPVPDAPRP